MAVTDDLVRYRDIERLGVGGMATVTLAEDTMLRRRVALKRVHAGGDARSLSRLRREALVGASLSHPNLVSIYDVEIGGDGDLVIVMEYVAGQTLRDAISGSGGLPPAYALGVLEGVSAALDTIHARGIVHRDVKPANILLGREGAIKLADLGIAVAEDRTQITNAGEILGTFSYMAPEQLEGAAATPAVDIYALAVVAFEMLSGRKARPQPNPVALAHAIATRPPPDLCEVSAQSPPAAAAVLKLGMAADPADRPRSAGELVQRLRAALGPQGATEPVAVPAPEPRRPPRPVPPPVPVPVPVAAAPPARPAREPRAAPRPEPAPTPRPAAALAPEPSGASRSAARHGGLAGGFRGKAGLILAGLAALGLAVLAVALSGSGGGTPAKRGATSSAGTDRTTSGAAGARSSSGAGTSHGVTPSGARKTPGAGASATSGAAPAVAPGAGGGVSANPSPSTPSGAVQTFYRLAASHQFPQAWALADPAFRGQLNGYQSFVSGQTPVRRITFQQARVTSQGQNTATVAVRTIAEKTTETQHCQGTVQVGRARGGGWVLDQISINCV